MAVIGKIREHSVLTVIVIAVALCAFIFSDFSGRSRMKSSDFNVGEVNGQEFTYMSFERKVDETAEMTKRSQQKQYLTNEEMFQIRNQVWNDFVQKQVYNDQFEKLGISVGHDELVDVTTGEHPHQYLAQNFNNPQTGVFDRQMFDRFMSNLSELDDETMKQVEFIIDLIENDTKIQKYNTLVSKGYYMPTALMRFEHNQKDCNVNAEVVQIPYKDIPDSTVTLTDADYQKYYNEHKSQYKQPTELRGIDYVIFEITPSQRDFSNTQKQINDIYNEFSKIEAKEVSRFVGFNSDHAGGYDSTWKREGSLPVRIDSTMFHAAVGTTIPPFVENQVFHTYRLMERTMRSDTMDAQHILIAYQGAYGADTTVKRTKAAAEKLADSLRNVVARNKSSMEDLALRFSSDPSVKENKGEFKRFPDGQMVPEFNEAVQNGKKGDIVVVETVFGFHVIKVGDKNKPAPCVRVAEIQKEIVPSSQTIQERYGEASTFSGKKLTVETFRDIAQEGGLNVRTYESLNSTTSNIPGITQSRPLVQWAFNEETKKGTISKIFESEDQFIVAILTDVKPEGYRPLESLKSNIESLVKREKKAEMLMKKIEEKKGSDLKSLAEAFNTSVKDVSNINFAASNVSNFGREPLVIGGIVGRQDNKSLSEPMKGVSGIYFVEVKGATAAPEKTDFDAERKNQSAAFKAKVSNMLHRILEEKADIFDNRVRFY